MTQPTSNNLYSSTTGTGSSNPFVVLFMTRDPTTGDVNYPVQKMWVNKNTSSLWILANLYSINGVQQANWLDLSTAGNSDLETLTGNNLGAVHADSFHNIDVVGDNTTIRIIGDPSTHTLTASVIGGTTLSVTITKFETSGTFIPDPNMVSCKIECIGAGGGAGAANSVNGVCASGGGAGGGYALGEYTAADIGGSQSVTVGTGGAGGTSSNVSGLPGSNTSVGSLLSAGGGGGGTYATGGGSTTSYGGDGTIGTGGLINIYGQDGDNGFGVFISGVYMASGGNGGNTVYGSGGTGSTVNGNNQVSDGTDGVSYGGGGGGAATSNNGAAGHGGDGSNGVVLITQYIQA